MLSHGAYVRDLACGVGGICMMSLTWDGILAMDGGVDGSVNHFQFLAMTSGNTTFNEARFPNTNRYMRFLSGAQKVYASHVHPRRFYVENTRYSHDDMLAGNSLQMFQKKEMYIAQLEGYTATESCCGKLAAIFGDNSNEKTSTAERSDEKSKKGKKDEEVSEWEKEFFIMLTVMATLGTCTVCALVYALVQWRLRRHAKREAERLRYENQQYATEMNMQDTVVMGRPVSQEQESMEKGTDKQPGPPRAAWGE